MGANGPDRVVRLLLETISKDGVIVHQIVCKTRLDHRTVKKYVDLMITIQNTEKIIKEQVGLRTMIKQAR